MKIVNLQVSDLKRIVAVDITPGGSVVEISGKNGQGKTSILDAVWWAFAGPGPGGKNITREPVRDGAEQAVIRVDIGDYTLVRRINPDGKGTITVENKDGMRAAKPQEMLDALVGEMTFDPLLFMRKPAAEKLDMLRSFAPGVDFDDMDAREKDAFATRRDLNRDVKQLEAVVAAAASVGELPEEVDVSALTDALEKATARNAKIREAHVNRAAMDRELETLQERMTNSQKRMLDIADEIVALREEAKQAEARYDQLKEEVAPLAEKVAARKPIPEPQDLAALTQELRDAQAANSQRGAAAAKVEAAKIDRERLAKKRAEAVAADTKLDDIRTEREDALKSIDLPIEGLEITPEGINFNGHPLEQASDAQQLRVGVALAMKANPKLRVIRIRDGSLLDDDSMQALRDMADAEEFQVWIETVGAGGEDAIVIEAGKVKSAPAAVAKVAPSPAKAAGPSGKKPAAAKAAPAPAADDEEIE